MRLRSSHFYMLVAVAVCMLSGCASAPQSGVERQAAEVKVYQPDQLLQSQYKVVRSTGRARARLPHPAAWFGICAPCPVA